MSPRLKQNMQKALTRLRYECDYEDQHKGGTNNFILLGAIAPGVGKKTLETLLRLGLIIEEPNRWHKKTGYRITDQGREYLTNQG